MNSTQGTSRPRRKRRSRIAIIIIFAIVAIFLIAAVSFTVYANTYSKSFPNIYVGDVKVSGKSADEIKSVLNEASKKEYANIGFNVKVGDVSRKILGSELSVAMDADGSSKAAMEIGRSGNVVSRAWSMMKCMTSKTKLPVSVTLDDGKIAAIVKDFAVVNSMPVNAAYKVEDDTLILSPAKDGKKLDEAVLAKKIRDKFSSFSYSDITVEPEISKATVLNLDDVYKKVHTDVRDAKISKDGDTYKVTPHVVGTDFDIAAAKAEYAKDPNATHEISLKRTQPKVTTPMLQSTLFQDTLSQQTTYFSPRKVNRTSNVRLAARLMNGTVLNPGEVFSFNNVVGPRTYGRGFREAQIFASGEIVDGLGGGICQVSSTLYMASMKADLKTVSRRNHSFYVDYAPKGQDATVVYGDIDFKFENSTKYPIKIMAYQQDNFVRVTIKGTKTEEKSVKIKTSVISTTPYGTKTQYDSSLSPGERVIKQAGQNGITMEAYRYVYDGNGNLLRKDFENRTKYVPLTEIVLVGSSGAKPAPAKPTPEKKPEPAKPAPPKPAPAKPVPPKPAPVKPKPEKPAPESGQKEDAEKNKPEVPAA